MAHDFDGDGRKELIVAPDGIKDLHITGQNTGGFEHAANLIDLDQDGTPGGEQEAATISMK